MIEGVQRQSEELRSKALVEPFSTVVVSSGQVGDLLAFAYGQGGGVAGSYEFLGTKLHTNMRVANQFVDESVEVIGLEWTIPPLVDSVLLNWVLEKRYQLAVSPGVESYPVRLLDVVEFARRAHIRFHLGGDKPFAEWPAITKPIYWSTSGARQQVRFEKAIPIGRVEKFWVEVNFWKAGPVFGPTSDSRYPACIPVVFRLFQEADADVHAQWSTVVAALQVVRELEEKLQQSIERVVPAIDPGVLAQIQKLRAQVGSDEELIDLLHAVESGIGGR